MPPFLLRHVPACYCCSVLGLFFHIFIDILGWAGLQGEGHDLFCAPLLLLCPSLSLSLSLMRIVLEFSINEYVKMTCIIPNPKTLNLKPKKRCLCFCVLYVCICRSSPLFVIIWFCVSLLSFLGLQNLIDSGDLDLADLGRGLGLMIWLNTKRAWAASKCLTMAWATTASFVSRDNGVPLPYKSSTSLSAGLPPQRAKEILLISRRTN